MDYAFDAPLWRWEGEAAYVLRLLQNNSKIRVPVGNANAVGLRQLISEQEIQEVFDILRERTIAFDKQTWNRRYRGFMDKIKTGSIYDVVEVLKSLTFLSKSKSLSFREKRMLDRAKFLVVSEISEVMGQKALAIEKQVEEALERCFASKARSAARAKAAKATRAAKVEPPPSTPPATAAAAAPARRAARAS